MPRNERQGAMRSLIPARAQRPGEGSLRGSESESGNESPTAIRRFHSPERNVHGTISDDDSNEPNPVLTNQSRAVGRPPTPERLSRVAREGSCGAREIRGTRRRGGQAVGGRGGQAARGRGTPVAGRRGTIPVGQREQPQ